LPDLKPLSVAAGLPKLDDMGTWIALIAPAATSPAIIQKIHAAVVKAYSDPVLVDRLEKAGITTATATPAELDAYFRAEAVRWTKFYKESGIKLN
jgi:tripartite-type tricarboxylate transporter receptor subunit TctC